MRIHPMLMNGLKDLILLKCQRYPKQSTDAMQSLSKVQWLPWLVWFSGLGVIPQWRVTSSIPSEGICLCCGPGPQLGPWKRQPIDVSLAYQCFSPSLSLSLPLSRNKSINIFFNPILFSKIEKPKLRFIWNLKGICRAKTNF